MESLIDLDEGLDENHCSPRLESGNDATRQTPGSDLSPVPSWTSPALTPTERWSSPTLAPTDNSSQDKPTPLGTFFVNGEQPRSQYSDWEIQEISRHLRDVEGHKWSQAPRLYVVLRTIGQLTLLDHMIEHGYNDVYFPFHPGSMPLFLTPTVRTRFLEAQPLVLTKAVDLEKGGLKHHAHFGRDDVFPFDVREKLGRGGYGVVDKIVSTFSGREFARKRFARSKASANRGELQTFRTELQVLKRISHIHCVELIGSYTDSKYFGLIMSPVATYNLRTFYDIAQKREEKRSILRGFFGCLANGLAHLHNSKIRHRDIKPENILVKGADVYLSDFGISLDWESLSRSTTTTDTAKSWIYCAPEVANYQKRNSSSDVWSLGCVFLEMCTVLGGQRVDAMRQFFKHRSDNYHFYKNLEAIQEWSSTLLTCGADHSGQSLDWTASMLQTDPLARPSADELFSKINNAKFRENGEVLGFCGDCCNIPSDTSSTAESASDDEFWAENLDQEATSPPVTDDLARPPAPQEASYSSDSFGEVGVLTSLKSSSPHPSGSPPDLPAKPQTQQENKDIVDDGQGKGLTKDLIISNTPGNTKIAPDTTTELDSRLPLIETASERCPTNPMDQDTAILSKNNAHIVSENFKALSSPPSTEATSIPQDSELSTREETAVIQGPNAEPALAPEHPTRTSLEGFYHPAQASEEEQDSIRDSVYYESTPSNASLVSETTSDIYIGLDEDQDSDSWPCPFTHGKLPALNGLSWTGPSILLDSIRSDESFMQFLMSEVPEAYARIRAANVEDLTVLIQLLILNGLDVNSQEYVDSDGLTPLVKVLTWGAAKAYQSLTILLINAGADANVCPNNKEKYTPLTVAATFGKIWAIKALIDAGADPHLGSNRMALHGAVERNHLKAVQYLIDKVHFSPDTKAEINLTPLHRAALRGYHHIVKYLLASRGSVINLNTRRQWKSPLYDACAEGHVEVVRVLLEYGADPNDKYSTGYQHSWFPMHAAASGGSIEIVRLLLSYGADVSVRADSATGGFFDETPIRIAQAKGYTEIATLLEKEGKPSVISFAQLKARYFSFGSD